VTWTPPADWYTMTTPERLRTLREAVGWNQAQAAIVFGVAASTWNRWEVGVRVPSSGVLTLLDLLGDADVAPLVLARLRAGALGGQS
jgi:DNA-binding transcriptional regulator YiaG